VRNGTVTFTPRSQENTFFHFMEQIRPWCVSRQLWWGHQIPVWYCPDGHVTVATSEPSASATCGSAGLERDPDVLDTLFSSGLWPFATLGWPDTNDRLDRFYPGNVNSTAREIINLWVARMLMLGIEFMGDVPFTDVVIHSVIQASNGMRMSKSLGTGVDPLELVERHGADGTRYGLLKMSSTQDVRFAEGMIEEGSKLANKLWNASRFALLQADTSVAPAPLAQTAADRWILSRLAAAQADVLRLIDAYDFAAAVKELYAFIWNDFCDWYVEEVKLRLMDDADRASASATLLWVIERIVALAHPMMPFVTEEIWRFLPGERGLLMQSQMPAVESAHRDPDLERAVAAEMEFVTEVRRLAAGGDVPVEVPAAMTMRRLLDRVRRVTVTGESDAPRILVDDRAEVERRLAEAVAERDRARAKLANTGFTDRAPAELVEAERAKAERWAAEAMALQARLA
jgi:valyl-tRNA synthetase